MITYYSQLNWKLRACLWGALAPLLLGFGYYPYCFSTYKALITVQQKRDELVTQLKKQREIIKNQLTNQTHYQSLITLISGLNFDEVKQKLLNKKIPEPHWQVDELQHAQLIVDGNFQQLNQLWQVLVVNFMPWRLVNFTLSSNKNDPEQLHLIINFETINKTNEIITTSSDLAADNSINPFNKNHHDTVTSALNLNTLKWFGALNSDGRYSAYALMPDNKVQRFDVDKIVGSEQWRVMAIDLQSITFKNSANQTVKIYYKTAVSQDNS